jgi:hypothetical protein
MNFLLILKRKSVMFVPDVTRHLNYGTFPVILQSDVRGLLQYCGEFSLMTRSIAS